MTKTQHRLLKPECQASIIGSIFGKHLGPKSPKAFIFAEAVLKTIAECRKLGLLITPDLICSWINYYEIDKHQLLLICDARKGQDGVPLLSNSLRLAF